MSKSPCFGIDLGTTASAIGLVRDGVPRLLPVHGGELLPSVVFHPPGEAPLVGQPALNALALDPSRGITSSKRHMGTDHRYEVGEQVLTPVDVAVTLLRELAGAAERELGSRPERAVITVPAWFTQAQRAETRLAGERAGLVVERILNEPTAAALAHAHGHEIARRVLVYDLGGGTFDVSLVEQDGPVVEVRASHGDSRLGGDDIDLALTDHVLRRLAETDRPLRDAIDSSPAARVRLRMAVEQAKVALSESMDTTLRVPFLLDLDGKPRHLELDLDRQELEEVAAPFVFRTLRSVDAVFEDSGVAAGDIDELLLVGGATLQPLVWHLLHRRYGLEGSHAISPRRAVALGAAIQAAIVDGSRTDGILLDVAPYPLSVGALDAEPGGRPFIRCKVLTPRNSPLPSRHTERFYTSHPRQQKIELPIFQGASADPRHNTVLGRVAMDALPPAPDLQGRPIRVSFRHDLDGLVHIEVCDELTGRTVEGQVAADGAEQAELRDEIIGNYEENDFLWAWPDGSEAPSREGQGASFVPDTDLGEARRTFQAVLDRIEELRGEHGDEVELLAELARKGLAAFEGGEPDAALEGYDALSDELFAKGVYL